MSRPVFADPKTDFVFHRIFGSEEHKPALLGFLNAMLELDEAHRIVDVSFLPPEQRPKVSELKYSIVDVKCKDARGVQYVVEMQVLNVEAFEKRVVYNVAKAYTNQLALGENYPELGDIIGISVCDFELWPGKEGYCVPMLSHWRMQERKSGTLGLGEMQFVFLELPKYAGTDEPRTQVDKWALFFREARNWSTIPDVMREVALVEALEGAKTAHFSVEEWDAYIRAGMAIQDERGALSVAERGGLKKGLIQGILDMCEVLGIEVDAGRRSSLEGMGVEALEGLRERVKRDRRWDVGG